MNVRRRSNDLQQNCELLPLPAIKKLVEQYFYFRNDKPQLEQTTSPPRSADPEREAQNVPKTPSEKLKPNL